MSDREHDILTAEERELQQRLARLGAGAEPPPALDARILSAARSSTASAGVAGRRDRWGYRRMRWPVGLGMAASLALAVGIAWQVRPLPGSGVQYSEAPAAVDPRALAPPSVDAMEAAGIAADAEDAVAPAATGDAAMQQGEPAPLLTTPRERTSTSTTPEETTAPTAQAEAGHVLRESPPPPAPPSPPNEPSVIVPAPQSTASSGAAALKTREQDSQERKAASPRADAAARSAVLREEAQNRTEASGSRSKRDQSNEASEIIFDEAPPASVDSPEVRAAWLARIRELALAGNIDAARESLKEFQRRYPRTVVPDDLLPLLR